MSTTGYECPTCEWDPPCGDSYYVKDGDYIISTDKRRKLYPRYENIEFSYWASMEFGGAPKDWDEVHKCPECNAEFCYSNSNY